MQNDSNSIMKVIADYGTIMKSVGIEAPIFYASKECYKVMSNPDDCEFKVEDWINCCDLPLHLRQIPRVIGMYCGVLIVESHQWTKEHGASKEKWVVDMYSDWINHNGTTGTAHEFVEWVKERISSEERTGK